MSAKHTPRPWVAAPYIAGEPAFAVGLSKWEDGTACGCTEQGGDYLLLTSCNLTEADAHLIAAAPDLLDSFEISLARAYAAGHQRGHEDTVEGIFTEAWREDTSTYFAADIREMMADGSLPEAQAAIAKATGKEGA
jgi:hypothetical protein